jgi:serine/threonine-protein kinase
MHPGFVRVFEAGILSGETDDVVPYLAMDWLDGEALDRQLQRMRAAQMPPLDLTAALSLMSAIVESAATAHSLGVAHLDIKPGNIFLSQRGSHVYPRLLDFGIAKMMRANPALADCSAFAARGPRAMTPAYAAPEQWLSDLGPTGPWTDVHALALTLVELLTGERAFKGHSQPQLQAACLATERPTPATFGCRIPARVERVFRRALSLEPRSRFPNARGFWRELCAAADFTPNSSLFVSNERFKLLPDEQSASSTSNSVDPTALSQLFSESCYGNIVRAIAQETSRQTAWRRLGSPKTITLTRAD